MNTPQDPEVPPDSQFAKSGQRPGWVPVSDGGSSPATASMPIDRPRAVSAASELWIVLGVLLSLASVGSLSFREGVGASLVVFVVVLTLGVLLVVFGVRMRRGADTRVALTVLGVLCCALLAVPAIVLQYRSSSNAWFDSHKPGRR